MGADCSNEGPMFSKTEHFKDEDLHTENHSKSNIISHRFGKLTSIKDDVKKNTVFTLEVVQEVVKLEISIYSSFFEGNSITHRCQEKLSSYTIPHPPDKYLKSSKSRQFRDQKIKEKQLKPIETKIICEAKVDKTIPHIIDNFDEGSSQIHYKYFIEDQNSGSKENQPNIYNLFNNKKQKFLIKAYPFENIEDYIFKNALYELSLYTTLNTNQGKNFWLKHYFIVERGRQRALVFVFHSYLCSLFDILAYRQAHDYHYHHEEQLYIAQRILESYRNLDICSITHRDIRASKIFLFDPLQKLSENQNIDEPGNKSKRQQSYQFLNLQSCRKITKKQYCDYFQNNKQLMLTPRGVIHYSNDPVKNLLSSRAKKGLYDFYASDRQQLAKVLCAIVTLNPLQNKIDLSEVRSRNKQLAFIIEKLIYKDSSNIQSVYRILQEKTRNLKIRTVSCLSRAQKFKYEAKTNPEGILTSDFDIATGPLIKILEDKNKKKIVNSEIEHILTMQQQHLYLPLLYEKIQSNYQSMDQNPAQSLKFLKRNVSILHRLGYHYERIGVIKNDFFREEVNLLIQICKNRRNRGLISHYNLKIANEIYNQKLSRQMKTRLTTYTLVIQNAYSHLQEQNYQEASEKINLIIIPIQDDKYSKIQREKFESLPLQTQLEALEAKGVIISLKQGFQKGELYFRQGLRKAKISEHETNEVALCQFQYLLAINYSHYLHSQLYSYPNKDQFLQKFEKKVSKVEKLLCSAKQRAFRSGQIDSIKLAKIHEALGDLYSIKQNYPEAIRFYKRCHTIYASEQQFISEKWRKQVIKKIVQLLDKGKIQLNQRIRFQKLLVDFEKDNGHIVFDKQMSETYSVDRGDMWGQEMLSPLKLPVKLYDKFSFESFAQDQHGNLEEVFPTSNYDENLIFPRRNRKMSISSVQDQHPLIPHVPRRHKSKLKRNSKLSLIN